MEILLGNWDTVMTVLGPVLGVLGGWLWRGRRQATKTEIERWARVASDFVLSLIDRGVIPVEEAAVMAAWLERFKLLLGLVGLQVSDKQMRLAKAAALERIGQVMMEKESRTLGEEARKLSSVIEAVLKRAETDRRSPVTP